MSPVGLAVIVRLSFKTISGALIVQTTPVALSSRRASEA
jgi:hypothetical protein